MIDAYYYEYFYIFIVLILTLATVRKYSSFSLERLSYKSKETSRELILVVLFMILFIGFRPFSIHFCDMIGYGEAMITHAFEYLPITWSGNYLFTPLMAFMSSHNCSERTPILVLAVINIVGSAIACKKLFPNDSLIAFLVVLGSFSAFGKLVNGIKAGCASSLLLCALAYRDNIKISVFFLFLSMGFHHSMQMAIAAYAVAHFYKTNEKTFFYIWGICLLLALAHVQYFQTLFGSMTDESGAGYLLTSMEESNFGGKTGFRIDFVLFSSVPVIVGYYAIFKEKIQSESYNFILNMYLITNAVWMLCMYAPYTNRIAEISWGIYPFALIYPFLKENWGPSQYVIFKKVVSGNVWFSFLMIFVYYTLIHVVKM